MAAEHFTAVTDATFGLEVEQHQGLTIVDFWGSPSWTSGRRGAGRATWWHPFWTSWRVSIKAS